MQLEHWERTGRRRDGSYQSRILGTHCGSLICRVCQIKNKSRPSKERLFLKKKKWLQKKWGETFEAGKRTAAIGAVAKICRHLRVRQKEIFFYIGWTRLERVHEEVRWKKVVIGQQIREFYHEASLFPGVRVGGAIWRSACCLWLRATGKFRGLWEGENLNQSLAKCFVSIDQWG